MFIKVPSSENNVVAVSAAHITHIWPHGGGSIIYVAAAKGDNQASVYAALTVDQVLEMLGVAGY
jgi:hypothetical protein